MMEIINPMSRGNGRKWSGNRAKEIRKSLEAYSNIDLWWNQGRLEKNLLV